MKLLFPDHRSFDGGYQIGGINYQAVTSVLRCYPTTLDRWAQTVAAGFALDNHEKLVTMPRRTALNWCCDQTRVQADAASKVGKITHAAIRANLTGMPVQFPNTPAGDEAVRRFAQWCAFVELWQPDVWAAEAVCVSDTHGYAGQLDLIAVLPGLGMVLIDTKATNTVQPRVALQLAALRNCEWIAGPDGAKWDMPLIDNTAVLHLRSDSHDLVRIDTDPHVFDAFRCLLGPINDFYKHADEYVLEPFTPPQLSPTGL